MSERARLVPPLDAAGDREEQRRDPAPHLSVGQFRTAPVRVLSDAGWFVGYYPMPRTLLHEEQVKNTRTGGRFTQRFRL